MPITEVEGPDGSIFEFPEGTSPDVMRSALVKHYGAPGPQPDDPSSAVGMGLVSGIPIVGPYLKGGLSNLAAGVRALKDGTTFDEAKERVEAINSNLQAQHPVATSVGEIGGAVLGTAPMVAAAPAAFGAGAGWLGSRMIASGLTGGAIGVGDAAVRSDGDPAKTAIGGIAGATGGFLAPAVGAGAGKIANTLVSKVRPPPAVPTPTELKSAASAAYQAADQAGVRIAPDSYGRALAGIVQDVRDFGFNERLFPKVTGALIEMEKTIGTSPTIKDMEILRRVAANAANSLDPSEKKLGTMLVGKIDDFVSGLKQADVVAGDPDTAVKSLTEARQLWARASKAEKIETATLKAERRAGSTGTGGNVDNATRQNIRAILDSPKQARGFTPDERAAMERVVMGTPGQNLARHLGKLSPEGNGLMQILGLGNVASAAATAGQSGAALAAAPHVVGLLAKRVADKATAKNVDALEKLILSGGEIPVSPLAITAQKGAERVVGLLTRAAPPVATRRLLER